MYKQVGHILIRNEDGQPRTLFNIGDSASPTDGQQIEDPASPTNRQQIEDPASPTDRQQMVGRIMDSTKRFETKARNDEPVFGATGVLLALHQRERDEVSRFNTMVGLSRYIKITENVAYLTRPETINHFVLADTEILGQQHRACPVCMYLPQKCEESCPFVRFFEEHVSGGSIRNFYALLLGTTDVLPDRLNPWSADDIAIINTKTVEFEDNARVHDPVYGITGIILSLYRRWWNLNRQVNLIEEAEQRHLNVQNFPTAQIGSCDSTTDEGKGIVVPESTSVADNESSTIAYLNHCLFMEEDNESLHSREKLLGKYMEFQHEVASLTPLPQEWNYSFFFLQGESSNSSPLSSVDHQMNQSSDDRLQQQPEQLPDRLPVQDIPQRIAENVPQNVPSQLQQLAAPSHSQQGASSSLRALTSSQQGMSSSSSGTPPTSATTDTA
ncbi:hypothetical protein MKW98_008473 [Papaver atlanticum]|uniref:LOB domain-containing protein n=1 Tax=Papaver atlanticum TaxID=357466 RepID=A0AAD4TL86_9MAGN|nr:hypothetical protein MKW98_008473 [Papaver atlanticum]